MSHMVKGIIWVLITINIFKNRLDTFWSDQEIIYDYTAEITGIGDRFEFIS